MNTIYPSRMVCLSVPVISHRNVLNKERLMCIKTKNQNNVSPANSPEYPSDKWRVVFQGIPGIVKPRTIEMKIPKSRRPQECGFTMNCEEHPFPKELL